MEIDDVIEVYNTVTVEEIEAKIKVIDEEFDMPEPKSDPVTSKLTDADKYQAAKSAVALDKFVEKYNLTGLAYYYEGGADSLHRKVATTFIVGNSILNAQGIPMCGEYDIKTCIAMLIMDRLDIGGSFAEFHPFDFKEDFILVGHDGPHHLRIAEGKPVTIDDIRCSHGIHEALFNAKYQDMMNFAIMYENNPRWGQTNPEDLLQNLLPFWTENYFKRNNYLKIHNKPVLIICIKSRFDSVFESVEQQREVLDKCREYVKKQGFDGLYISVCLWESESTFNPKEYLDCDERGYDFHISYNCRYSPEKSFPPEREVIEGQCRHLKRRLTPNPLKHVPVASCFRDATPRTTEAWNSMGYKFGDETIYHLSPEGFREVVSRMKKICDDLPDGAIGKRIFMIDNWNEWDEGHYVSPSHEFGFKYLQAIREELTERDNLPDYRTPQDMGFTELNKSWEIPDLGEICQKKFLKKVK